MLWELFKQTSKIRLGQSEFEEARILASFPTLLHCLEYIPSSIPANKECKALTHANLFLFMPVGFLTTMSLC